MFGYGNDEEVFRNPFDPNDSFEAEWGPDESTSAAEMTELASANFGTGHSALGVDQSRLQVLKQRQRTPDDFAVADIRDSADVSRGTDRSSQSRILCALVRGVSAVGIWLCCCCGQGHKCTRKQRAWWLVIITMFLIGIGTVFIAIELYKSGEKSHVLAWFTAGMAVLLATPISVFEIFWHLVYFTKPRLQRYIIRIIWMVPIYGIESWFALKYTQNALYLQALREFYEAYVIWSFTHFLMSFLGETEEEIIKILRRRRVATVPHLPPFCCLRPWACSEEFFYRCKVGVLQYVVVKIITTVVTVLSANAGAYGEGSFDLFTAYPYVVLADNCSQIWALYCLALFYHGLHVELAPYSSVFQVSVGKGHRLFQLVAGFGDPDLGEHGFHQAHIIP